MTDRDDTAPLDEAAASLLYRSLTDGELLALRDALTADLQHVETAAGIAFCHRRLALIAAALRDRQAPTI